MAREANPEDFEVLYDGDFIQIISPEGNPYEASHDGNNLVHVVPVDVKNQKIYIRSEVCPPYTILDSEGYEHFYTVISGGIEEGEEPEEAAMREVREEAGVYFESEDDYDLIPLTPPLIPYMKAVTQRISVFMLLMHDFETEEPEGDGTEYEERSDTLTVDMDQVDEYLLSDQCDYLLHAALAKVKLHIFKTVI